MFEWDENSGQVTRISVDKEKARALLKLVEMRERDLAKKNDEFVTLIVEGYYEIVKELITAIMAVDGWKTLSHELLIGYLARFYKEFESSETYLIDQLRKTRNEIAYRGLMIQPDYLKRNRKNILEIISKLKKIVTGKIR